MTRFYSASITRLFASCIAIACCFASFPAQAYQVITQSLTSDIWNEGSTASANYADGYNNNGTTSTVELARFVPLDGADPLNVNYTQGAETFDLASFVLASGGQRGAAQGVKVNGYTTANGATPGAGENLYLKTEPNAPNEGFGAHANWFVTFDLDDIRTAHFEGRTLPIDLTGTTTPFLPWIDQSASTGFGRSVHDAKGSSHATPQHAPTTMRDVPGGLPPGRRARRPIARIATAIARTAIRGGTTR